MIRASETLAEINLSGNPITGSRYEDGVKRYGVEEYDCGTTGFAAFLDALRSCEVSKLSISDCDIGPNAPWQQGVCRNSCFLVEIAAIV